jgi:hypothetical protein
MNILTKITKSKTLAFGYALTTLGVLWDNMELIRQLLPADTAGKATAAIGLAVVVLRALTNKPLSEK